MKIDFTKMEEDRDVVRPFVERLLLRLREKHPGSNLTMDDIDIIVEVKVTGPCIDPFGSAAVRIRRMLSEMDR